MINNFSRIVAQPDGHLIVKYYNPKEYAENYPYLNKTRINEEVDVLNAAIYAEAMLIATIKGDVKPPHCYGILQS